MIWSRLRVSSGTWMDAMNTKAKHNTVPWIPVTLDVSLHYLVSNSNIIVFVYFHLFAFTEEFKSARYMIGFSKTHPTVRRRLKVDRCHSMDKAASLYIIPRLLVCIVLYQTCNKRGCCIGGVRLLFANPCIKDAEMSGTGFFQCLYNIVNALK